VATCPRCAKRFIIETPDANISSAMHALQASYANWYKAKYKTVGSIFQNRFKSVLVEDESYLINLSVYIHLNPVKAKMVSSPEKYQFSSCRFYFFNHEHELLTRSSIEKLSGGIANYKEIVFGKINKQFDPEDIYGKTSILGSDEFRSHAITLIKNPEMVDEIAVPDVNKLRKIGKDEIGNAVVTVLSINKSSLVDKAYKNLGRKFYFYFLKKYTSLKIVEIAEIGHISYKAAGKQILLFEKEMREKYELQEIERRIKKELEIK